MLKLYHLREDRNIYFIAETECNQVFLQMGTLQKMQDAMIGFQVPLAFWDATPEYADNYWKWLKATLF